MPDAEQPADDVTAQSDISSDNAPVFSRYGIGSAVLAVACVAAVVLTVLITTAHRGEMRQRTDQTDAMQAAVDWTGVLINMNTDNIDDSLRKLHDGTVGQLNADFEASVEPYREVVQTLKSRTTGRIDSVAIESIHHDLNQAPGAPAPPPSDGLPPGVATRTDTVLVIATSVSQNASGQPQTVQWNLRLDVSEVDGKRLISRLESRK